MDILSVVFFAVAGAWLLVALFYSIMVLIFLRMRARNTLGSIYDEDFGRIRICGCCHIRMGWLFRRYARHLQLEDEGPRSRNTRFMTRDERRAAMEALLLDKIDKKKQKKFNKQEETERTFESSNSESSSAGEVVIDEEVGDALSGDGDDVSMDGPMCCICLGDYENDECVFEPKTCSHRFHKVCILDWLQRHGKTDCPCCREGMVTEDEVWGAVKKLRKQKKKQLRRERRKLGRNAGFGEEEMSETEEVSETEEDVVEEYLDEELGEIPTREITGENTNANSLE